MKNENSLSKFKKSEDFSNLSSAKADQSEKVSTEETSGKENQQNLKPCKKSSKNWLKSAFKTICLSPVYVFKFCISPLLPHSCIFVPTCSNYMIFAVKEFGVFKGFWLGIKRLFRCVPWQKKRGLDPVPINIKGEHIWIL